MICPLPLLKPEILSKSQHTTVQLGHFQLGHSCQRPSHLSISQHKSMVSLDMESPLLVLHTTRCPRTLAVHQPRCPPTLILAKVLALPWTIPMPTRLFLAQADRTALSNLPCLLHHPLLRLEITGQCMETSSPKWVRILRTPVRSPRPHKIQPTGMAIGISSSAMDSAMGTTHSNPQTLSANR